MHIKFWISVTKCPFHPKQKYPFETSGSVFVLGLFLTVFTRVSTFHILHISPKNCPWLIHGSKTEIKKGSAQIFFCVPEKQNSKIKLMSFSRKFLPRYKKNLFFWLQNGGRRIYGIDFYKYSRLGLVYHFCLLKYGVRLWGHFVTFIACIPQCKQYWRWAKVQRDTVMLMKTGVHLNP